MNNNIEKILGIISPKSIVIGDKLPIEDVIKNYHQIEDVRSAAFYAFGQSKITNENVVLITDGDYLSNTYTVLTEAWFQKTNLIILAIYKSIYDVKTNFLNRCTVQNMMLLENDVDKFEKKIKQSLSIIGPKIYNIVIENVTEEKNDYGDIIKILNKAVKKEDTIFTYNGISQECNCNLKNIDSKYKYGILSKYLAFTTLSKNVGIIVCDASCLEIDSNILNNRCMNNDFKLIIKGNILKVRKWIENNKVRYIECENLEKDIYNLYNSKEATVLVIKGGK